MQGGGCTPNTLFFLVRCLQPLLHISLDLAPPTKVPSRQIQGLGLDAQIRLKMEVVIVVVTSAIDPNMFSNLHPFSDTTGCL